MNRKRDNCSDTTKVAKPTIFIDPLSFSSVIYHTNVGKKYKLNCS